MSNIIALKDIEKMEDKLLVSNIQNKVLRDMAGGVKRTSIIMKDNSTGRTEELHNRVVISGSIAAAVGLFNLELPAMPTYNTALELQNSVSSEPTTPRVISLFCVGDDGCGVLDSDVFVPNYIDRIPPSKVYPFRYIEAGGQDIDENERELYFGRKVDTDGNIMYYFKAFDNQPQMYLRYTDGTEINPATMYNVITSQEAECFVKADLNISRLDFRDYFDKVLGWDKARISSLSLCYAWYLNTGGYKWYQDIIPFTKLNFSFEKLVDSTKSLSFEYSLFF